MAKLIWEIDLIATSDSQPDVFSNTFFEGTADELVVAVNKEIDTLFTGFPNVKRVNGSADTKTSSREVVTKFFNVTKEKWKAK